MNKRGIIISGLAVALITALLYNCDSAKSAPVDTGLEDAKKAIAESNAIYFKAFATGDSSIFINRYAEDACILAPGVPALCGPDAPLQFFRTAYHAIGLRNGKFITTEVYGLGKDFVVEEGLWQSFDAENVLFDDGKFLVLWKKTKKGWKMYRDSFSSNHVGKSE